MKYKFEQLINRSYEAIKARGLITPSTKEIEFINKIHEELSELTLAYHNENKDRYIEELTDLATVAIMQIHHLGYDFIKEFEKVIIKNEQRND